ncbi:MAG: HAMP domain-containing histidine kinase [Myxococcota bacterium]|nr:HAMP domain-containing histidine kinase [Myxococcota bacterium]
MPGEKIAAIADAVHLGLALCREGRVWWASDRMLDLLGCDSAEGLEGECLGDRFADSGQGLPNPDGKRIDCEALRDDQSRTGVQVHCIPVRAGQLWIVGDAGPPASDSDCEASAVHSLEVAQREIACLREELRQAGKEREELHAELSHELRTPLTVISGYNRLLRSAESGPLTEVQRGYLSQSEKSCKRLDNLVEELLEVSHDGMVDLGLKLGSGCLRSAIAEACESVNFLGRDKSLDLDIRVDADAGRAVLDPVRIVQVLVNLLSNAIRFSPPGGRIVVAARRVGSVDRPLVEVSVADEGPGISGDECDRIFEPYVRVGGESRQSGMGLGLAICKRLVVAHGGRISVENQSAGGSRFTFTLPSPRVNSENPKESKDNG